MGEPLVKENAIEEVPEPESAVPPESLPSPRRVSRTELRVAKNAHKHQPIGVLPAVQSLIFVLVASLFVMTFTMQPIRIPSASMEPTLLVGDFLLMNKAAVAGPSWLMPPVGIARGDVVVFHDPVDDPSVHLVKRVVGLPGDRIHLRDGVVYVNDVALKEPYAVHRQAPEDEFRDDFPNLNTMSSAVNTNWWIRLRGLVRGGDITVPARSYFVLGDNRNDSEDSRYWGFVPRDYIVGKPLLIYFSFRQPGSDEAEDAGLTPEASDDDSGHSKWDLARWRRVFRVVR